MSDSEQFDEKAFYAARDAFNKYDPKSVKAWQEQYDRAQAAGLTVGHDAEVGAGIKGKVLLKPGQKPREESGQKPEFRDDKGSDEKRSTSTSSRKNT